MKKKVVFVKDVVFDKYTIWDRKPIPYSNNNIKEFDEQIIYIEILKLKALEIENI